MRIKKQSAGLTLIEVLIALAIVTIALTAVIKASDQNIRGTTHIQNKVMANWVGQQILNEARTNVIRLSTEPGELQKTKMLGREWYSQAWEETTPNKHIKRISVKVFANESEDDQPIISLETYKYDEK